MQGIDVILKSQMNRHMVPNGRSPCVFHLKEEDHFLGNPEDILGKQLRKEFYQVRVTSESLTTSYSARRLTADLLLS
jgi:hypothetical protein